MSKVLHTRVEAAEMLSMSIDSFEKYVQPHVRWVQRGRLMLIKPSEVQRWADSSSEFIR